MGGCNIVGCACVRHTDTDESLCPWECDHITEISNLQQQNRHLVLDNQALGARIDDLESTLVTIMGSFCSALRINAPHEDAVGNWQTVVDEVASIRWKLAGANAMIAKLGAEVRRAGVE